MSGRLDRGLQIYKRGLVTLIFMDKELIIFSVLGSKGESYEVARYFDYWICLCDDYQFRHKRDPGSFACKHLEACHIELAMILLFGENYSFKNVEAMINGR